MTKFAGVLLAAAIGALAVSGCAVVSGAGDGISAFGDSLSDASRAAETGRNRSLAYDPASCLPDSNGKQPTALCKTQKAKSTSASARSTKSAKAQPARAAAKPAAARPAAAKPIPVKATTAKPAAAKAKPAKKAVKAQPKTTVVNTAEGTKIRFKSNSIPYDPATCLPDANGKQPTTFCKGQKVPR